MYTVKWITNGLYNEVVINDERHAAVLLYTLRAAGHNVVVFSAQRIIAS
jgi:hypothetical protein